MSAEWILSEFLIADCTSDCMHTLSLANDYHYFQICSLSSFIYSHFSGQYRASFQRLHKIDAKFYVLLVGQRGKAF